MLPAKGIKLSGDADKKETTAETTQATVPAEPLEDDKKTAPADTPTTSISTTTTATMATAIRPPFEPFVYGNSPSTLSSRWEVWLNDYNDFILVNSLDKTEEAARNKAHFRMHVGLEVKQIWATVEDKTEDIGTIQEKLTTQIVGQRSSVNERFKFWTASPSSNETTEKYVLRLRSLAAHCDFESLA